MPGRFPRRAVVTVAIAGVLVLALWAASDRPPRLPADADHGADLAESRCLECHSHAGREPRPADHPQRDDCYSCHEDAAGSLHPRRGAPQSLPGGWESDPRLR